MSLLGIGGTFRRRLPDNKVEIAFFSRDNPAFREERVRGIGDQVTAPFRFVPAVRPEALSSVAARAEQG